MPRSLTADGRRIGALTRDEAVEALREYAAQHGPDFNLAAFNPATARWQRRPELIERYRAGRADGRPWPSANQIRKVCGSWNAARLAAGLPINKPGPGRRRESADIPDFEAAEPTRVVVRHIDRSKQLAHSLALTREREARAKRIADELRAELRDLRGRLAAARREADRRTDRPELVERVREVPRDVVKVKVEREVVRVPDKRGLATAKRSLERTREQRDEARAQLRAITADRDRLHRVLARADRELTSARAEAAEARRGSEAANTSDRALATAEARVARLREELAAARSVGIEAAERASVAELVAAAERRADEAEARAVRAERIAAEHGQAVTGELRRLTRAEMEAMQERGPAGPRVLGDALGELAAARRAGNPTRLSAALDLVARAAVTWRARL